MGQMQRKSFSQQALENLFNDLARKGVNAQALDIRIDREGVWYHEGTRMHRVEIVKMLASILTRLEDGSYWLVNPAERGQIEVEDAPFIAHTANITGKGKSSQVHFITNLDEEIPLDEAHPLRLKNVEEYGGLRPYIHLRGRLEARISRQAFYDLVDHAVEEKGMMGIWSYGAFFTLSTE